MNTESTFLDITDSKKSNRCFFCNKKLKPVNFLCSKCNSVFCLSCRLPETHKCDYDFKQDKIVLDKVVKDKVTKI